MHTIDDLVSDQLLSHPQVQTIGRHVGLVDNLEDTLFAPEETPQDGWGPRRMHFNLFVGCLRGSFSLRANLEDYHVQAGDVLLLPEDAIVEPPTLGEDCQYFVIIVDNEANRLLSSEGIFLKIGAYLCIRPLIVQLSETEIGIIHTSYQQLRWLSTQKDFSYRVDMLRSSLCTMASILMHRIDQQQHEQPATSRKEQLFNLFLLHVQEDCMRERSVGHYAQRLFITPKYLSHLVKDISGHQPSEWINSYVLLHAMAMLSSGQCSVLEVSQALGFPNASHFGKFFKKHVGCTPRTYQIEGNAVIDQMKIPQAPYSYRSRKAPGGLYSGDA